MYIEKTQPKKGITTAIAKIIMSGNSRGGLKLIEIRKPKFRYNSKGFINKSNKNRENIIYRNADISRKHRYYSSD